MALRKKIPPNKPLPSDYEERLKGYKRRYKRYIERIKKRSFRLPKRLRVGEKRYYVKYYTDAGKLVTEYVNEIPENLFEKYGAVKEVGMIPGLKEEKSLVNAEKAVKTAVKSRKIDSFPENRVIGHVRVKLTKKGKEAHLKEHLYFLTIKELKELHENGLIKDAEILKK